MQFRRSLYISFAAHMAVFGTAVAFAHYGWERSRSFSGPLTLSLVSEGFAGSGRAAARARGRDVRQSITAQETGQAMPELSAQEGLAEQPAPEHGVSAGAAHTGPSVEITGGGGGGEGTGSSGPSPGEWRLIHARIEEAKTYPRLARERGIEGVVLLRFRIATSGNVETVDVVKSSGSPVLDEASVQTVYRAAPLPAVNGWIEVPMSYMMK